MSGIERSISQRVPAKVASAPFSGRRCESYESLCINKPDSSPRKPMRSKLAKESETSCPLSPRKPVRSASPSSRNIVWNATAQSLPETSFLVNDGPRKGRRPSRRSSTYADTAAVESSLRKPARQVSPAPSLRRRHRSASMPDMAKYQQSPRMPVRTSTPRKLRESANTVLLSNDGFHDVVGSSSPSLLSSPKKPTRAPSPNRTSCSTMSTSQLSPSEASSCLADENEEDGRERKMELLSRQADRFSLLL